MALTKVDTQLLSNGITTDSTGLNTITNGNLKVLASAAGTDRKVIFQNELGTQATLAIGTTGSSGGTSVFYIQTNAGYTLTCDASGYVKSPYNPSLSVYRSSASSFTVDGSTPMQWDGTYHNRNSSITISNSNSRFTVPTAGTYLVSASYFLTSGSGSLTDCACDIRVNGTSKFRIGNNIGGISGSPSNNGGASAVVINLAANDYIDFIGSGAKTLLGASPAHSQLSIFLIG